MTNRQKGILSAITQLFTNDKNRFCARHIYANFKVKFLGVQIKNLFWVANRATNLLKFNTNIEAIKDINVAA